MHERIDAMAELSHDGWLVPLTSNNCVTDEDEFNFVSGSFRGASSDLRRIYIRTFGRRRSAIYSKTGLSRAGRREVSVKDPAPDMQIKGKTDLPVSSLVCHGLFR